MSKKALEDKDYEPDEEDETSTEDLSTDSGEEEEDSDLENMDEQESQVRSGFEDAQPWPSELSQYMSPNIESPPASVDLSASIIPPPPPSVEEIIEVPATSSKEGETPKKKAKLAFELDTMTQAFREGRETYNGFKITQHPKIKRKKKNDDPDEKDITGAYALDEDSHM